MREMREIVGMREGLTERIIGCIIEVHRTLGAGFLEAVYRRALGVELVMQGLTVESEKAVLIHYKGRRVGRHRLDFIVESEVVVELKTVEAIGKAHYAQVRSYLAATGLPTALLVNFSGQLADYRRVDAPQPAIQTESTPPGTRPTGNRRRPPP
jgi:GxxExxY protein